MPKKSLPHRQAKASSLPCLKGAAIDEARLARFDVLSFDVFETLLRREHVFKPTDLFLKIGAQARALTGLEAAAFASLRIRAEREARFRLVARYREEVSIDEIYSAFNSLLVHQGQAMLNADQIAALARVEIDYELAHLKAIPDGKALFDWAIAHGKTVVLVSDFYMGATVLREALQQAGYTGYDKLFVSVDLDKTKHGGTLYRHVYERLNASPHTVLHVGDNLWSDGSQALRSGIAFLHMHNPTNTLIQYHEHDWRQPTPGLGTVILARQAELLFGQGLVRQKPEAIPVLERVGRECLGPLLLGMASWLYCEADRCDFKDYFFCSRDGLVMKGAFDLFQSRFGTRASSSYLELSRQVIYRARAAQDPAGTEDLFCQNWLRLTPDEALRRWGLDPAQFGDEIASAGFASANEPIPIGDRLGDSRLRTLFANCRKALVAANQSHAELFFRYLDQSGLAASEAPCIVDIGWQGSLQKGLNILLSRSDRAQVAGRYLGLFLKPEVKLDDWMAGYLFSVDGTPTAQALRASPSLVELLHTAAHGSVRGYQEQNRLITALYEERAEEAEQYRRTIGAIQSAALESIAEALQTTAPSHDAIPPVFAFAGLNRLLNRPARDEIEEIGRLRIASNYGATAISTALIETSEGGYRLWDRPFTQRTA